MPTEDLVQLVSDEIRRYLTQYPEGADTEEGIQRWWLAPWCAAPLDAVRAALSRLQAEGFVRPDTVPGGQVLYRRRPERDR